MYKVLIFGIIILSAVVTTSAQTLTAKTQQKTSVLRPASFNDAPQRVVKDGVVLVGPRTTYLQVGLSTEEVVRLLGEPATRSEREEQGVLVTTYEFSRSEGRILIAEFVKDALIRSRTEIASVPPSHADESR